MLTYQIIEGQLAQFQNDLRLGAWALPNGGTIGGTIDRVFVEDFGGNCFCDVIVLTDGRTILVSIEGAVHEENNGMFACIYPSLDAAYDGENQILLSVV